MNYWLMKSEPSTFSIEDLHKRPNQTEGWEGVRNFQARNYMRDKMRCDDLAFFYHSSCPTPGIAGIIRIAKASYPDLSALDPKSDYYDPKSSLENPRWFQVDVQLVNIFKSLIPLSLLKQNPKLTKMVCLQPGSRLSISPVTPIEWHAILDMIKHMEK